jgi:RHS repeat-associated protein
MRRTLGNSLVVLLAAATLAVPALASPGPAPSVSAATLRHATLLQAKGLTSGKPARLVPAEDREVGRPADEVKLTVHRRAPLNGLVRHTITPAQTPQPPFTECPAIGEDTSCGILIQITNAANNILGDPTQPPYDGTDDTLIGLLNNSSDTIGSIQLSSDTDLFGFDGDGICTYSFTGDAYCSTEATQGDDPYDYEGPGTTFSDINSNLTGGTVNFSPGIAPGQTVYFSLEEPLTATTVTAGGPTPGEQGGPVNLSENPTTCTTGDPVNCATGTFWQQFTDFSVPGNGVPLDLSRTYSSSQASVDGPFGYGWTDSYNMSLSTDSSGDVTVTQEDGSTVTFEPNGAGGYTAPPRVLATLAQNSDGTFTFVRDRGQVEYNFSAAGQLTSEVDPNGYLTQLGYNASGQLTTVTDPTGRTLTFSYTGANISKVTDPMGRTWSYSYDSNGNLATAVDPLGRTWSFSYSTGHLLLAMTNPRGGLTTNVYNSSGQVTSQTDPDGNKTTWSYSGDPTSTTGGTTTMTDPDGDVTTYQYSDLELMSVTHASGTSLAATTSYNYDPATLGVTSVTDPDGNVTNSTYDSEGNLLSTTDPLGNATSYSYNSFNEVLSKTTPLGETTSYSYDEDGNLLSVTDPDGNTTSYAYADSAEPGESTSVTNPDGDVTTHTYDTDGDVISSSVSPSAKVTDTTAYAYDADGEQTCEASPNATAAGVICPAAGHPPVADTTTTAYDADGEITSATNPDGHTTSYAYDAGGDRTRVTDPDGDTTTYTYNGDNEQTEITRADGSNLTSSYDADGNLIRQVNAAGDATTYTFDALGRMTSTTNSLGYTTSYGYDSDGNRTTLTNPSGAVTTYSYDADSQLTGISYSGGTTPNVSYTYDADGHRASMTDGTGTTSYSYDGDGHVLSVTNGADATVSYGYDAAGNITSLTYPNGKTVTRAYNGAGWLSSVTDWLGHTTAFGYDHDGNLVSEDYPNSVLAATSYDDADQVTGMTDSDGSATLAHLSYTLDNNGQVTKEVDTGDLTGTSNYSYDPLNQLASVDKDAYSYDLAGDPTSLAGSYTESFNSASEVTSAQRSNSGTPAADVVVSANQTSHGSTIVSPTFSTKQDGELLVAFISAAGPASGKQSVSTVTGDGLIWTLAARSDTHAGTAEIWETYAATVTTAAKVTATLASAGYDGSITVAAFTGAQVVTGAHATASGDSTSPSVSLTTTSANSLVWGTGDDSTKAVTRTPASGQSLVNQYLDTGTHATYWSQKTGTVSAKGTKITLADTTSAKDNWNLAAVDITSAASTKTTYSYNAEGYRTAIAPADGPATVLSYDQAGRLVSYGNLATYAYNGDGLRMSKTADGTTTSFTWDQSGSLPLLLASSSREFIYGPGNQAIEQIQGTTPSYLQDDRQGSTRLITSSTGAVVATYSYTPYGSVTRHTGTVSTPLEFDGDYTDGETGFQYLQARYYDPVTAQFISLDPLAELTQSPYGYTSDDPLNLSDPTGMGCWGFLQTACSVGSDIASGAADVGRAVAGGAEDVGGALASVSPRTWGEVAAGVVIVGAGIAVCAAVIACIGIAADVIGVGGAEGSLEALTGTLGLAETWGEVGTGLISGGTIGGVISDGADIAESCLGHWASPDCGSALADTAFDLTLHLGDDIPESTIARWLYKGGSAAASFLYDELTGLVSSNPAMLRC